MHFKPHFAWEEVLSSSENFIVAESSGPKVVDDVVNSSDYFSKNSNKNADASKVNIT